jgi:hypothetical protein
MFMIEVNFFFFTEDGGTRLLRNVVCVPNVGDQILKYLHINTLTYEAT